MMKSVAVDLDGVLAQYDGWEGLDNIGDPVEGAREFMETLMQDYEVVVYTTRCNPDPFNDGEYREAPVKLQTRIRSWLNEHGIPYTRVFAGYGKPIAVAYVDDRAVPCQPHEGKPEMEFSAALRHVESLAF